MSFSLLPRFVTDKLTDITPQFLEKNQIELLMLDFDNTIVPYTTSVPTERTVSWLREMAASNVRICVVSNSQKPRVRVFCEQYGIACITHAKKPFSKGIAQCLAEFDVPSCRAALVGDQIFTDTLGGNCVGVTTILVKAIHNHNFWLKARHVLEMPFIVLARNRRMHE